MASKKFLVDIDLKNNQLTNASLQNLLGNPATAGKQPGWIYFDTGANTAYVWTGSAWLDLGRYYTHATPGAINLPLGGANVLATLVTNNEGHVTSYTTRTLTLADLGYTAYVHPAYTPVNQTLTGAIVLASFTSDAIGSVTGFTTRTLTAANIGAAPTVHTHVLTDVTDVTATKDEVNYLDLSAQAGLASGMVLRATGANSMAWSQILNDAVNNSLTQGWSSQKIQTELNNITSAVSGGLIFQGGYNAATNVPDLDVSPSAAIKKGWTYVVTTPGLFFTEQMEAGDELIAAQDAPTLLAHWVRIQKNVDVASETVIGLVQIATQAQTNAGILDQFYAITPLKLKTYVDTRVVPATTAVAGIIRIATQTEVNTGTDNTIAVTPLTLATAFTNKLPVQATETTLGIAELATQAETDAGTDDLRIVTPLKLKVYVAAKIAAIPGVGDATETARGVVEIATQAEVNAGTLDAPYAVTPLKLKTLLDNRVGGYAQDVGDGAATAIAVTHNLNTRDVSVTIYENSTGEEMEAQVVRTSVNVVTVTFNVAPTAAQYRVVIKK
jgi:hypothetical protein